MSRSRRSSRVSRLSSKAFNRRSTKSRPLNRAPKPSSHKRWSTRAISKKWRRADSSSSCGDERSRDSPEPRRSRKQKNRNISRKACPGPPLDSGFRRNDGSGGAKAAKERKCHRVEGEGDEVVFCRGGFETRPQIESFVSVACGELSPKY